jgi:biopolymer transport protein ExbB
MSIGKVFSLGGIVMIPLILLSVLTLALILERLMFWFRIVGRQPQIAREVLTAYPRDLRKAFDILKQNLDLPIARTFLSALRLEQSTPEEFRLALETAAQAELPTLKRFSTLFDTVISVAPLLGLLGTILGLIDAFSALRVGDIGGTDSVNVTVGISQALVSTAAGLIVAIVTLFFANLFRGLYLRQRSLMVDYGGQLELLHRRHHRSTTFEGYPYATS